MCKLTNEKVRFLSWLLCHPDILLVTPRCPVSFYPSDLHVQCFLTYMHASRAPSQIPLYKRYSTTCSDLPAISYCSTLHRAAH